MDPKLNFPNQGKVSWLEAPEHTAEGMLFFFSIIIQPSYELTHSQHDRFKTGSTPKPLIEVIDLRATGDEEAVRRQVTELGVELAYKPTNPVYIWLDNSRWVGPIELTAKKDGMWRIDPTVGDNPLSYVVASTATQLLSLPRYPGRWFVDPLMRPPTRKGQLDWSADDIVLERALVAFSKLQPKRTEVLRRSKKMIEEDIQELYPDSDRQRDQQLEQMRLRRAQVILADLDQAHHFIQETVDALRKHPHIAAKLLEAELDAIHIGEAKAHLIEERARSAAVHIEAEAAVRVADLERQLDALRLQEHALRQEIEQHHAALSSQLGSLDAALTQRLAEIVARPHELLSEVAILRAALAMLGPPAHATELQVVSPQRRTFPAIRSFPERGSPISSDVGRPLSQAFRLHTLRSSLGWGLHSAFLSG